MFFSAQAIRIWRRITKKGAIRVCKRCYVAGTSATYNTDGILIYASYSGGYHPRIRGTRIVSPGSVINGPLMCDDCGSFNHIGWIWPDETKPRMNIDTIKDISPDTIRDPGPDCCPVCGKNIAPLLDYRTPADYKVPLKPVAKHPRLSILEGIAFGATLYLPIAWWTGSRLTFALGYDDMSPLAQYTIGLVVTMSVTIPWALSRSKPVCRHD